MQVPFLFEDFVKSVYGYIFFSNLQNSIIPSTTNKFSQAPMLILFMTQNYFTWSLKSSVYNKSLSIKLFKQLGKISLVVYISWCLITYHMRPSFSTYANFSYPLIRIHTLAYEGVQHVSFIENVAYVVNGWSLCKNAHDLFSLLS